MPIWNFDRTMILQFGAGDITFNFCRWEPLKGFVGMGITGCETGPIGPRPPETLEPTTEQPPVILFFDRVESCDQVIKVLKMAREQLVEAGRGVAAHEGGPAEPLTWEDYNR